MTNAQFQNKVDAINEILGTNYEIDNAPIYGGRQLYSTTPGTHGGRSNLNNNRMAPKLFDAYLVGMLEVLDIQRRIKQALTA